MAFQSSPSKADEPVRVIVDGDLDFVDVIQPENENRGGFKRGSVKQQQRCDKFNPMIFGPAEFCCCGTDLEIGAKKICFFVTMCTFGAATQAPGCIFAVLLPLTYLYGIRVNKPRWMLLNTIAQIIFAYLGFAFIIFYPFYLLWIHTNGIHVEFGIESLSWIAYLLVTALQWHFASVFYALYRKMKESSSSNDLPANGYVIHEDEEDEK